MAIKGQNKLMRQLKRIPHEVKIEAHKALSLNADEHVSHVKQIMPVRTGGLRSSVKKYFRKGPLSVQVDYGDAEHFYGGFVEAGRKGVRSRPVFWPMYRAFKKRYKARLARALTKGLKRASR